MNQHKFINPGVTVIVIHWGEEQCSMVLKLTLPSSAVLQEDNEEIMTALKFCTFLYILPFLFLTELEICFYVFILMTLFIIRSDPHLLYLQHYTYQSPIFRIHNIQEENWHLITKQG